MQAPSKEESSGGVTVSRSTFNLVKNVVGAGILAIPGGVSTYSQSKAAVYPTIAIIVALGSLSGYCFRYVTVGPLIIFLPGHDLIEIWSGHCGRGHDPSSAYIHGRTCIVIYFTGFLFNMLVPVGS